MNQKNENTDNSTDLTLPELDNHMLGELLHGGNGLTLPFMKDLFLLQQAIVGMRYQGGIDQLILELIPGSRVTFVREPENRFDHGAVMAIDEKGRKLGYVPRHENAIIGALLSAGKYIYGLVPDKQPHHKTGSGSAPYSFWVDLYMREFILPEDITRIPRHGYEGSYAVTVFTLSDAEDAIDEITAIKVINGEERNIFRAQIRPEESYGHRELLVEFDQFAGYLPIVSHQIKDGLLRVVEEAYGVLLGKTFSNQVIDTAQMARNHLPHLFGKSLDEMAEYLDIQARGDTPQERRCREIWELYGRMEHSELEKRNGRSEEITPLEHKRRDNWRLDRSVETYPMSLNAREILRANHITTLRELSRCSETEVKSFRRMNERGFRELTRTLEIEGYGFRPEGEEKLLYSYPEELRQIAEKKESFWEVRLLFGCIIVYYEWLRNVRKQKVNLWQPPVKVQPIDDRQKMLAFMEKKLKNLGDFGEALAEVLNVRMKNAMGEPGHPGDVRGIVASVERLMKIYKNILRWQYNFSYLDAIEVYRELIEEFYRAAENLYDCIDEIYEKSKKGMEQINDCIAGKIKTEDIDADLCVKIDLNLDRVRELMEEVF